MTERKPTNDKRHLMAAILVIFVRINLTKVRAVKRVLRQINGLKIFFDSEVKKIFILYSFSGVSDTPFHSPSLF